MCPHKEVLSLLVSGIMPKYQAERIKEHISKCKKCSAIYTQLLTARRIIQKVPPFAVEERTVKHTVHRIQRYMTTYLRRSRKRRSLIKRAIVYASAVAIVLFALYLFVGVERESGEPPSVKTVEKPYERKTTAPLPPPKENKHPGEAKEEHRVKVEAVPKPDSEREDSDVLPPPPPIREVERPTEKEEKGERLEVTEVSKHPHTTSVSGRIREDLPQPLDLDKELARFSKYEKANDISAQIEELHRLAKLLKDANASARDRVRNFLVSILNKKDKMLRCEALVALGELGDKESVYLILSATADPDWQISTVSVPQALASISNEDTVEWLLTDIFPRSNRRIRVAIARALAYIRAPVPFATLADALKRENDPIVRYLIAESLGHHPDKDALSLLKSLLKDRRWFVRDMVVTSMGRIKDGEILPDLIKMLSKERSSLVKASIARVLSEMPDERAIRPLIRLLRTKDRRLFGELLKALVAITGRVFWKDSQWRDWLRKTGGRIERKPEEAIIPADFYFMEIPFYTNSIVFVIDCSAHMRRTGRTEMALKETEDCIRLLPDFVRFNIICFDTYARFFNHRGLAYATSKNKEAAIKFLRSQRRAQFASSILYDAVKKALDLTPDDIVLITAGVASCGKYTSYERILFEISFDNILRKTRLHTVGLFNTKRADTTDVVPVGPTVEFLRNLARQNNGNFIYRWVRLNGREK